jgi:hypothetical protein
MISIQIFWRLIRAWTQEDVGTIPRERVSIDTPNQALEPTAARFRVHESHWKYLRHSFIGFGSAFIRYNALKPVQMSSTGMILSNFLRALATFRVLMGLAMLAFVAIIFLSSKSIRSHGEQLEVLSYCR